MQEIIEQGALFTQDDMCGMLMVLELEPLTFMTAYRVTGFRWEKHCIKCSSYVHWHNRNRLTKAWEAVGWKRIA